MKLINGKGEETLTPQSQAKEKAKGRLKELGKKNPTTVKELAEEIKEIKNFLGI